MFGWKKRSAESMGSKEVAQESLYSFVLGDSDPSEVEGTYLEEQCKTAAEFENAHPEAAAAYLELVNMTDISEVSKKVGELNNTYYTTPKSGGYYSWSDGGKNKSGYREIRLISYSDGSIEFRTY